MIATRVDSNEPAVLSVRIAGAGGIRVVFDDGETRTEDRLPLAPGIVEHTTSWMSELDDRFYAADTSPSRVRQAADRLVETFLPRRIQAAIASWQTSQGGHTVIVVDVAQRFVDLPWELLPWRFGDGMFVVRLAPRGQRQRAKRPEIPLPVRVAAAGWEEAPGGPLPGIARELNDLSIGFDADQLEVSTHRNWQFSTLGDQLTAPEVLHLSIASGFRYEPDGVETRTELTLFPNGAETPTYDTDLLQLLRDHDSIRLLLVNTMPNPVVAEVPLLRRLCTQAGVAVVGWGGSLQDTIAVDFARFWYQRALEGLTVAEISGSFAAQFGDRQWVAGAVPMIWVPTLNWVRKPAFGAARFHARDGLPTAPPTDDETVGPPDQPTFASPYPGALPFPSAGPYPGTMDDVVWSPPSAQIRLELRDSLFPALLVNGHRPMRSLSIDSNQDFDGVLQIDCDTGGGFSTYRLARSFLTGPNTIVVDEIDFPAIYELIGADDRRVISITVSVFSSTSLVAQETKSVPWLSRRDWLNDRSGWPFVAAHVLTMSSAVAELVNRAQDILMEIGKPTDRFEGYPTPGPASAEIVRNQVRAIFQAVRSLGLRYIAPPGLPPTVFNPMRMHPDHLPVSETPTASINPGEPIGGQLVRTPADIIERRHGTCHDLALLFAAALEYVSLYPLIILMPGHTYFGYWVDQQAHVTYWTKEIRKQVGREPAHWTIPSRRLSELVADGSVDVVEPNTAAHSQGTFDRALQLALAYGDSANQVVDVQRSRRWVQPVTLL